jgi:hypothetical protein
VRPSIGGDDLRARGVPPGPQYKRILDALRDARLDGTALDEGDELRLLEQLLGE